MSTNPSTPVNCALFIAASAGFAEKVRLLLDADADIHAGDNYGDTALSLAGQFGNQEIIELLASFDAAE